MLGIRPTLRVGAVVFGFSALFLIIAPGLFLDLLLLDGASSALQWAMRMIGLTLIALAANMWIVARTADESAITVVAVVMAVVASALGALTLAIPAQKTWFTWCYALVGFAFGVNYVICLLRRSRFTASGH